ncbi:MAG: hypothetical protein ACR2H1_14500, partial [Limisphaerales bacterium]
TGLAPDYKRLFSPTFYFSSDRDFDIAVAQQITPSSANIAALIANFNYEAGCNPVNVTYITGLGSKRQRETVNQYAQNDRRVLPPSGIPLGNMAFEFLRTETYELQPNTVFFPANGQSGAPLYALYDRWADAFNVNTEFVHPQIGRGLAGAALLSTLTTLTNQAWSSAVATIQFPNGPPTLNSPTLAQLNSTLDLTGATVVWEVKGQEPALGFSNITFTPNVIGETWIEAEANLPDGRRVYAASSVSISDPINGGVEYTTDTNTVALYHFNGDYDDISGHGYNLTAFGNVTRTNSNTVWMRDPGGEVARFRNVGDYLTVATISDNLVLPGPGATPLTIEFWIYPREYKGSDMISLFNLYQDQGAKWQIVFGWQTPNAPEVRGPKEGGTEHVILNQ